MPVKASFLIFGDSGSGKTAQLGEFGKWVFKKSGGKLDPKTRKIVPKSGKITRIYTADSGGWQTLNALVTCGIVQIVPMQLVANPFSWVDKIARGMIPKVGADGKTTWVKDLEGVGFIAYEGITAFSDCVMQAMADMAARGINIGGDGAFNFTDGDRVVGSNNRGHYIQAQSAIARAAAVSQWALPDDLYVAWTATARRGEDENSSSVLGPQAAGKALTHELPRLFAYTMRISAEPQDGGDVKHVLYLDAHKEKMLKGAVGLGNARIPLDAVKKIPSKLEPASLVKAYELILEAEGSAEDALVKEFV